MGRSGIMKIIFFGTPEYVIPILDSLHKAFKSTSGESPIVAVVTQSPKPSGRKQQLEYSAVDTWAHKKHVPIFFDAKEIVLKNIKADIGVLASFGAIIPDAVLKYFQYGILVIHPSLLPQFRWSSPVPAAIITNTNPTGVSIIKMDNKFDHGPIVTQFKEEIKEDDTYGTLRDRLFAKSADVLVGMLPAYIKGKINLKMQDDSKATFAGEIGKKDAFIPPELLWSVVGGQWSEKNNEWKIPFIKNYSLVPSAYSLDRFIRAMQPWPIAWTNIQLNAIRNTQNDKRLKILKAHIETRKKSQETQNEKSYSVSRIPYLALDEVQLEGKNPVYPEANFSS